MIIAEQDFKRIRKIVHRWDKWHKKLPLNERAEDYISEIREIINKGGKQK